MKKKLLTVMMAVMMAFSLSGCGNDVIVDVVTNDVESGSNQADTSNLVTAQGEQTASAEVAETNPAGLKTIPLEDVKIGVLYIGSASDTSGYTYAHELGIQGMVSNLGLKEDQVVRKESIDDGDDAAIKKALDECMDEGCNIVFTTSWGYMEETAAYAEKYPDVYFAHGTGYMSNGSNFTNYFGRIYQARYLSGLVAGMKTKSNLIGYVSAMGSDNSECTGGIDAFAMGVEEVNPDATLTSVIWNWSAYYTSYVNSIVNATYDGSNYYGGMDESLVGLTGLSSLCEDGTQEKVNEMQQKILSGEFGVFDGEILTNDGTVIGEEGKTLDDATITGKINWYYHNVEVVDWK